MDWKVYATIAIMLGMAATVPTTSAQEEDSGLVAFAIIKPNIAGCDDGAHVVVASFPGFWNVAEEIPGCQSVVFTKPASADVQMAITGGANNLICTWRPLDVATCGGLWVETNPGTTLQLTLRAGSPGAVTAIAA